MSSEEKSLNCIEIQHEYKTEFSFKSRHEMDLFLKKITRYEERDKKEMNKKILMKDIKQFQINFNISNFNHAKKLYLVHLDKIENIDNI